MTREEQLKSILDSGEEAWVMLGSRVVKVWYMPREDFGWKHNLTLSPLHTNKIYREFYGLQNSLTSIDKDWYITEKPVEEEEVDDEF